MTKKHEGLTIPTVWVAIVTQLVGLLFFAGVGWSRVGELESKVSQLQMDMRALEKNDAVELRGIEARMVKIELGLNQLNTSLTELTNRLATQKERR